MSFAEFANALERMGATLSDAYRLDNEGMRAAMDAHGYLYDAGEFIGIEDFKHFCRVSGRKFVLDNIGDIFTF